MTIEDDESQDEIRYLKKALMPLAIFAFSVGVWAGLLISALVYNLHFMRK